MDMDWLNPMEWIGDFLNDWFFKLFKGLVENELDLLVELFDKSVTNVQGNVFQTPMEFSPGLVETLRSISETAILPIAGLILTYIFCYELYQMVVEQNKGRDFETGQMVFLIIKTSVAILLVTHSFDIALAFFDVSQWMTNQVPKSTMELPETIKVNLLEGLEEGNIGQAILMAVVTLIGLIVVLVMTGIVYLVAWARIVTIVLYISVAPLPFATFMNKDWIGSIGQNYVKNLLALMLQGFFMLICLVVYGALLEKASTIISQEGSVVYGLILMVVTMGVLVVMLTKTHSIAKSVVGAV